MSGVRHAAAGDDDHVDRVAAEPHLERSELAGAVALVAELRDGEVGFEPAVVLVVAAAATESEARPPSPERRDRSTGSPAAIGRRTTWVLPAGFISSIERKLP